MTVNQQIITIVIVVRVVSGASLVAGIGLLVVYCLKDAVTPPDYGLAEFLSIAVIVLIHKWKHSTLLSIAAGTGLYMAITQLLI